jgi:hypothetical protein
LNVFGDTSIAIGTRSSACVTSSVTTITGRALSA